ncbi:phenylacetate--CoA ligase family protein [Methylocucumis oryzae]|uniref:phenylacetate--CoA ligase family protein n=1 Tax=Methylocucumis oryzae TaxID=1632867 RepID=UPI000A604032|nr:phenylacetate--CoA ligase family protein [Methylocucumis oryzae]
MTDANTDFDDYFSHSIDELLGETQNAEANLIALFKRCNESVPAYQHYLSQHGVDASAISDYTAFTTLPLMTKTDYMRGFTLPERCYDGNITLADRIAVSSGSTGQALFWPRSERFELGVTTRFEQVFHDSFQAQQKTTLAIVCFALGNWVGGLFTTSCCWRLARKDYRIMVATPGNNKAEIFRVVRELAPLFEQTVLLGYPPFIKDVLDAGSAEGIAWSDYQLKLVFAGEVFSEEWRQLLSQRTGSTMPCFDSASLYGTADGGVLGNETPFSIAIRRWLAQHPEAALTLFGEARLPTLVQYDPASRFFEVHDNTLVVSGDNTVPLVRYHIADKGGVISYEAMWAFLNQHGIQHVSELLLPEGFTPRPLPFVFVFGRADFTVSYYGANIYPENISVGLEQPELNTWVTGKICLIRCRR